MTMIYLDMVYNDSETHSKLYYYSNLSNFYHDWHSDIFDMKIHHLIQNLVCNTLNASAVKLDYHFNLWSFAKRIT